MKSKTYIRHLRHAVKRNGVAVVGGGPRTLLTGYSIFRRDRRRRSEPGPTQFPLPRVNRHRLTAVPPAARGALAHAAVRPAAVDAHAPAAAYGGRGAAARAHASRAPSRPAGADRRDGIQHLRRRPISALMATAAVFIARHERVHGDGDGGGGGAGVDHRAVLVVVEPRRQLLPAAAWLRREVVVQGGLVDDRLERAAGAWLVPRGGGG